MIGTKREQTNNKFNKYVNEGGIIWNSRTRFAYIDCLEGSKSLLQKFTEAEKNQ